MKFFQIKDLILISAFYVIYITKMLMLKKQNIQGTLLGKGQKPKNRALFEIVLSFTTFLIVPIQFGSIIFCDYIYFLPFPPIMHIIGLVLLILGNLFFLTAIMAMRNNWRAGYSYEQDTHLVTDGIYRISRNPAFTGFDLFYLGSALAYPNIANLVLTLVAIILFHIQILGEEKFLIDKFGNKYHEYRHKVRRYL
jgi:protein-S-isoprenylcysteine O-methyltransferase Ste14